MWKVSISLAEERLLVLDLLKSSDEGLEQIRAARISVTDQL